MADTSSGATSATNGTNSTPAPEGKPKKFKYLIFLGNNSDLLRVCLQRRSPWWQTSLEDESADGKISTVLGSSSMFGGPPRRDYSKHKEMAEKALLANAFDFCWRPTLGLKLSSGATITIHSPEPPPVKPGKAQQLQLLNHYPSVKCIASKTGLLRSLLRYYSRCGVDPFANVPTTFILRDIAKTGSADFSAFCAHFRHLQNGDLAAAGEKMPPKHCKKNMWLIKPSYANQGRGIKVFATLQEIKDFLLEHTSAGGSGGSGSRDSEYICQKYIERPLLTGGRKFDLRIWVVATDNFDIYVYNDGYVRTSSEFYTTNNVPTDGPNGGTKGGKGGAGGEDATLVHLTNYCRQVS
jgi:Tubulin-tyrosine ligase family